MLLNLLKWIKNLKLTLIIIILNILRSNDWKILSTSIFD